MQLCILDICLNTALERVVTLLPLVGSNISEADIVVLLSVVVNIRQIDTVDICKRHHHRSHELGLVLVYAANLTTRRGCRGLTSVDSHNIQIDRCQRLEGHIISLFKRIAKADSPHILLKGGIPTYLLIEIVVCSRVNLHLGRCGKGSHKEQNKGK